MDVLALSVFEPLVTAEFGRDPGILVSSTASFCIESLDLVDNLELVVLALSVFEPLVTEELGRDLGILVRAPLLVWGLGLAWTFRVCLVDVSGLSSLTEESELCSL